MEFPSSLKAKQNPTNKLRYAEVQPTSPQTPVLPSSKHGRCFRKQVTGFFTSCSVGLSLKFCLVIKSVSVCMCVSIYVDAVHICYHGSVWKLEDRFGCGSSLFSWFERELLHLCLCQPSWPLRFSGFSRVLQLDVKRAGTVDTH